MAGSPGGFAAFGIEGAEPMVFGGGAAKPEPTEAQNRVIDGVPEPRVERALASIQERVGRHTIHLVPLTSAELKRQLRARLRVVNAEIKLRGRLESERDELNRLLAAANAKPAKTSPPRADVRPIRDVAG